MSDYILGVNATQVDTVARFTRGIEVKDPRAQDFPQNWMIYVRAGANITAGDAVKVMVDQTDEPFAYTPVTATGEIIQGVAHATIASGSFGWITRRGRVASVTITAVAVAAGDRLASGASGDVATKAFTTTYGQEEACLAAGVRLMALDSASSTALSVEAMLA